MVSKYCEFQPTQHRNKRPANMVFLDDEDDKHPLAICDVCANKLKLMNPAAIVRPMNPKKAAKAEAEASPSPPATSEQA